MRHADLPTAGQDTVSQPARGERRAPALATRRSGRRRAARRLPLCVLELASGDAAERRPSPAAVAVDAFATYRLTRLVIEDKLTEPARTAVFRRWEPASTRLGYFLTCPWCVSIWAGLGVVAARRALPAVWGPLAEALACSAVTGIIAERL